MAIRLDTVPCCCVVLLLVVLHHSASWVEAAGGNDIEVSQQPGGGSEEWKLLHPHLTDEAPALDYSLFMLEKTAEEKAVEKGEEMREKMRLEAPEREKAQKERNERWLWTNVIRLIVELDNLNSAAAQSNTKANEAKAKAKEAKEEFICQKIIYCILKQAEDQHTQVGKADMWARIKNALTAVEGEVRSELDKYKEFPELTEHVEKKIQLIKTILSRIDAKLGETDGDGEANGDEVHMWTEIIETLMEGAFKERGDEAVQAELVKGLIRKGEEELRESLEGEARIRENTVAEEREKREWREAARTRVHIRLNSVANGEAAVVKGEFPGGSHQVHRAVVKHEDSQTANEEHLFVVVDVGDGKGKHLYGLQAGNLPLRPLYYAEYGTHGMDAGVMLGHFIWNGTQEIDEDGESNYRNAEGDLHTDVFVIFSHAHNVEEVFSPKGIESVPADDWHQTIGIRGFQSITLQVGTKSLNAQVGVEDYRDDEKKAKEKKPPSRS